MPTVLHVQVRRCYDDGSTLKFTDKEQQVCVCRGRGKDRSMRATNALAPLFVYHEQLCYS